MSKKRKFFLSFASIISGLIFMVIIRFLGEEQIIGKTLLNRLMWFFTSVVIIIAVYASKLESEISLFECKNCGNTFKVSFKDFMKASHTVGKRRLKCPKCGEKTWCKRTMNDDNQ